MTPLYSPTDYSSPDLQPTLHIEPWLDPVVDEVGHDPRSAYVETYWLPVLGPSTTWLLRRFATHLDDVPGGLELDQEDLARALGLGERSGPNAPFARTLKRCVDFDMAHWREASLAVRRHLPPLAGRHLRRLPESLQQRHASENSLGRPSTLTDRLRLHGRRLALSLLDYGEDRSAVEQQLMRWAFHPALASECASWAVLEHARRRTAHAAHPARGAAAAVADNAAGTARNGSAVDEGAVSDVAHRDAAAGPPASSVPTAAQSERRIEARLESPRAP